MARNSLTKNVMRRAIRILILATTVAFASEAAADPADAMNVVSVPPAAKANALEPDPLNVAAQLRAAVESTLRYLQEADVDVHVEVRLVDRNRGRRPEAARLRFPAFPPPIVRSDPMLNPPFE